jgi:hypothetical protein
MYEKLMTWPAPELPVQGMVIVNPRPSLALAARVPKAVFAVESDVPSPGREVVALNASVAVHTEMPRRSHVAGGVPSPVALVPRAKRF